MSKAHRVIGIPIEEDYFPIKVYNKNTLPNLITTIQSTKV
jgi:hypothetical protein